MKYALLVFQPQEQFDRGDPAAAAAGKAYGEALRAALEWAGPSGGGSFGSRSSSGVCLFLSQAKQLD